MKARALASSLLGISALLAVVGCWLHVAGRPAAGGLDYEVAFFVAFLGFAAVGAMVAWRVPSNPVGWLLLAQGISWELAGVMAGYANGALSGTLRSPLAGRIAAWAVTWLYIPALAAVTLLVLLFPNGRLPSRRWRPAVWLTVLGAVLTLANAALAPGPLHEVPSVINPLGLPSGTDSALNVVGLLGNVVFTLAFWTAVGSLVFRFRRAGAVERQQLKWLAVAGGVVAAAGLVSDVLGAVGLDSSDNVFVVSLLAVPLAVGISVFRYRLYDVDLVINKTLVFGGLAVFITAVYLAVVVGIGAAVGRGGGSNVTLAVVATALVAVAFQPVNALLHRTARRVVFGPPTTAEERAGVAVHCLGAFRVFRDGEIVPVTAWQSKKARTLMKILVSRRGRSTTREFLMDTLWPDEEPASVGRRLSVALTTVRVVLDPDKRHPADHFLIGDKDAVRLDLAHLPVDVEQFLHTASSGLAALSRGDTASAETDLRSAAALYVGDFLEEDQYEDWALPLRDEARLTYVSVLRGLARCAESTGALDEAARVHARILDVDPWNEEAHLGLVRMLERAGRHGEARGYFDAYRRRMDELGVPAESFPFG